MNEKICGEIKLIADDWVITGEPHMLMRLRRILAKVGTQLGELRLRNNDETCRDLAWFLDRFTLAISRGDRARLEEGSKRHKDTMIRLDRLVDKKYKPGPVLMAVPPRDYQVLAAELLLQRGFLLLGDDVGTGKTVAALCALTDPRVLPAVVVTLSGTMPIQWERMTKRFLPDLNCHIVDKGTSYPLPRKEGRGPDIVILNYHKLHGWAETLARYARIVIFDEAQELRRAESKKYEAATMLARSMKWKMGLSVGPDSMILVDDGNLVRHVRIDDFAESVGAIENIFTPVDGVKVRAFDGKSFCWKAVTSVLKHRAENKKTIRILTEKGRSLLLTEDHSIYRVVPDGFLTHRGNRIEVRRGNSKAKPFMGLELVKGNDLQVGDHVLLEDGIATERAITHLEIVEFITVSQWYVIGDFSDWIDAHLTDASGIVNAVGARYRQKTRGLRGTYVTGEQFMADPVLRNRGGKIHTRGKGGIWTESKIPVEALAYVLGFYLGDGWVSDSRICFAVEKRRLRSFLKRISPLLRWTKVNIAVREMRGASVEVRFTNAVLAAFFRGFFRNARAWEKQIPDEAFLFRTESVHEFIQGMLDSDGSFSVRPRGGKTWSYTTTSRDLAYGLAEILKRVNVVAGISRCDRVGGGVVNGRKIVGKRPKYLVHFSHYEWLGDNEGFRGRRSRFGSNGIAGFPVRIKEIREERSEYVYDLSVKGSGWETFVASGILVHNSATPIFNFGGEIYNVLNVLQDDVLGTPEEFEREWCLGGGGRHLVVKDPKALGAHLRAEHIMLRRTRADVGRELPALQKIPQYVESDERALDSVKGSAAELAKIILRREKTASWDRLRAHEQFNNILRQATGVAKAPFVADFIRLVVENGESCVVFCWHREVYAILQAKLADLRPVLFTGSESVKQKEEARQAFIDGKTKILLMSLRAGQGLDGFQDMCRTVIFAELDWSPGVMEQCIGRVQRDGQKDPVTAFFLVAERGADPTIAEKLGLKTAQSEGIRNPEADILEELQVDQNRIRDLAEQYLKKLGIQIPDQEAPAQPAKAPAQ